MPQYDIYIHSDTTQESQTKPRTKKDAETEAKESAISDVQNVIGTIENPDSLVSRGVGLAMKAMPEIAAAFACVKVAEKITTTVEGFKSISTGDYRFQTAYNNFKTNLKTILTPFSSTINAEKTALEYKVQNERLSQYRELTGDAIINSYGKGV